MVSAEGGGVGMAGRDESQWGSPVGLNILSQVPRADFIQTFPFSTCLCDVLEPTCGSGSTPTAR